MALASDKNGIRHREQRWTKSCGGLSRTGAILGIELASLAEVIGKPTKFCGFKYSKAAFAMKPKLTLSPRAR
jgi:hypothetical protein